LGERCERREKRVKGREKHGKRMYFNAKERGERSGAEMTIDWIIETEAKTVNSVMKEITI
jgi:hypothetical protein